VVDQSLELLKQDSAILERATQVVAKLERQLAELHAMPVPLKTFEVSRPQPY
jgi:hypothetical protein